MPSTDSPTATLLKSAVILAGGQTGKVGVDVGVTLPVGVRVAVAVEVGVDVVGVILPVAVAVAVEVGVDVVVVDVDVGVTVTVVARLRKMTIVCEAAVPSKIRICAVPPLRSLLINRSAGIV